jgi:hypothetical protein
LSRGTIGAAVTDARAGKLARWLRSRSKSWVGVLDVADAEAGLAEPRHERLRERGLARAR